MLDKDGLTQEVSVGVTYASLMSAVSLFFAGFLISQYQDFEPSIKVPLVFLIISSFSFIFSATIYSNASTELTLNKLRNVRRYMVYAKNIDEVLGLYLFILATPMVLGAVTNDGFLRIITIVVALLGFTLYSQSRFSVLDDELTRLRKRLTSIFIVLLTLLLYYFQGSHLEYAIQFYSGVAVFLLGLLIALVYRFCTNGKQYNTPDLRAYDEDDALGIADLITKNIRRLKSRSISKSALQVLRNMANLEAVEQLASSEFIMVAEFKGRVAGFASLNNHEITNILTDPDLHRKGIGHQLVESLEGRVSEQGSKFITAKATKADKDFYRKLGYQVASESDDAQLGAVYHMKKKLR